MSIKKFIQFRFSRLGFVSLCVMQALAMAASFCGVVIYQVQRMSQAQHARLKTLSDKSLIKVLCPSIIQILNSSMTHTSIIEICIDLDFGPINLVVKQVQENDSKKICKIEILNEKNLVQHSAYLLLLKDKQAGDWCYRSIQFGTSL